MRRILLCPASLFAEFIIQIQIAGVDIEGFLKPLSIAKSGLK
jgi:hypothetical protein